MTLAVAAACRLELRIVSRCRLRRPPRTLIAGILLATCATDLLGLGTIVDHGLGRCASLTRDAGMAFIRAGLHCLRVASRRSIGLWGPFLGAATGVAATTAARLDR